MNDPVSHALNAVASRSIWAPALLVAAGAASGVGPCAAPRCLAVAALSGDKPLLQKISWTAAFAAGITIVFSLAGVAGTFLSRLAEYSSWCYGALAVAMGLWGAVTLWRGAPCTHGQSPANAGAGGAFFLGACSSCVVSPCCMPVAAAVSALASASGGPLYVAELLACFAAGHALPLVAVASCAGGASGVLQRFSLAPASTLIGAALMLALSGYYAVLM